MKSIKLEGNCSNPTAINVCKRRLLTCCHLCTCSCFGLSSSPNHYFTCVIIDQSPYREFYHTSRYPLAGILHNSRYYLRTHFGQIEIFPVYTIYICCIYTRITMMPPRVLASGPKPCRGNYLKTGGNNLKCLASIFQEL